MSHPDPDLAWDEQRLVADVAAGPQGSEIGAFFDFDGTLIDGYSLGAFARHHVRSGHVTAGDVGRMLLIGLRPFLGAGLTTEEDFERFFVLGMRAWAGRSEEELTELGERLWRQGVAGSLYPEAWRLVAAHRRAGHTVVLASSATRFQVQPAAAAMGVPHVLVTPVEFADGLCTGRPGGPPLWRAGKAAAVRAFAPAHGIDLQQSYAYSNGDEDVAFLEMAGRARALNPGRGLAAAAREHGWPVARFRARGRGGVREAARALGAVGGTLGGFGAGVALGAVNQLVGHGTRRDAVDLGLSLAGDLGTALAGVTLDVRGAEHLVAPRPAVFLFNHQSQLDVLILAKLLRGGFSAVAKKEAARIPGFGAAFRLADVAFVDRANSAAARAALEPAVARLHEGISLVIAPEGTRSATPAVGPFKKGAFHVAMQAGVPIVPIVVRNAGELMWRGASTIREGTVHVTVLPPVSTEGWRADDIDEHVAAVRALYTETLDAVELPATAVDVHVTDGPTGPVEPLSWGRSPEMGGEEAAVWRAETGGPRSTLTLLEVLDPAPDPERLAAAHEWASRMVPRMRQRVLDPTLGVGPPIWVDGGALDVDAHLTRVRLPAPGSRAQLLDAVAEFAAAPLDRTRPLWASLLVEGLEGGAAGWAVKIHQSVTDDLGAVRLMGMLHSRTAERDPARPEPAAPVAAPLPTSLGLFAGEVARRGADVLARPVGTGLDVASGLVRALGQVWGAPAPTPGRTPLLAGRGGRRRVEVLEVPLAALRAGAAAAGGSPHDGFLAAVLGALHGYHLALGADPDDVDDTTVALGLPVGMGAEDGAGGRLAGAVVDAPLAAVGAAERVAVAREYVLSAPSVNGRSADGPGERAVDVQVGAVPGIGHPVYFAGSRITRLYPIGPLAGCAATVTMVAHDDLCCIGLALDDAAVTAPDLLRDGLSSALAEILALR